jgi:hypothetical protein
VVVAERIRVVIAVEDMVEDTVAGHATQAVLHTIHQIQEVEEEVEDLQDDSIVITVEAVVAQETVALLEVTEINPLLLNMEEAILEEVILEEVILDTRGLHLGLQENVLHQTVAAEEDTLAITVAETTTVAVAEDTLAITEAETITEVVAEDTLAITEAETTTVAVAEDTLVIAEVETITVVETTTVEVAEAIHVTTVVEATIEAIIAETIVEAEAALKAKATKKADLRKVSLKVAAQPVLLDRSLKAALLTDKFF